jgi:hypothetical protein
MTFFWTLFIISFLITFFVIILLLLKKYRGWKSFFIILLIVNILTVCLVIAYIFYLGGGMAVLAAPLPFATLLIIDLIMALSYFFIRHRNSRKDIIYAALIPAICLLFILSLIVFRFS